VKGPGGPAYCNDEPPERRIDNPGTLFSANVERDVLAQRAPRLVGRRRRHPGGDRAQTDFWRKTFYGYVTDNGHFYHRPVTDGFSGVSMVRLGEVTAEGEDFSLRLSRFDAAVAVPATALGSYCGWVISACLTPSTAASGAARPSGPAWRPPSAGCEPGEPLPREGLE